MTAVCYSIPVVSGTGETQFCCQQSINPHMKKIIDSLETFHLSQNWLSKRIQATTSKIVGDDF